jgi:hypothetical protein
VEAICCHCEYVGIVADNDVTDDLRTDNLCENSVLICGWVAKNSMGHVYECSTAYDEVE